MFLNAGTIRNLIIDLGLVEKYSLSDVVVDYLSKYLLKYLDQYSEYQKEGREFVSFCNEFLNATNTDSISLDDLINYVNLKNTCTYFLYKFKIYCKNDVRKSIAAKFLQEFTGKNITEILDICGILKTVILDGNLEKYDHSGVIPAIFDYHLALNLARIFYVVNIIIKYDAHDIITTPYYSSMFDIMKQAIYNQRELSEIMQENINQLDNYTSQDFKHKTQLVTEHSYNIYRDIYKFICKKKQYIIANCKKTADLDLIIGSSYSIFDADYLKNNLFHGNFGFVKYILDNSDTGISENMKSVSALKLPVYHKKFPQLVIEI